MRGGDGDGQCWRDNGRGTGDSMIHRHGKAHARTKLSCQKTEWVSHILFGERFKTIHSILLHGVLVVTTVNTIKFTAFGRRCSKDGHQCERADKLEHVGIVCG